MFEHLGEDQEHADQKKVDGGSYHSVEKDGSDVLEENFVVKGESRFQDYWWQKNVKE